MITIINYGSGNISAIGNIYERLKIPFKVAETPKEVIGAQKILLPGVGAFDETIEMLDKSGFRSVLDHEVLKNKVPVLGICVGMQILAKSSEEGTLPGLGWINGVVKKIDKTLIHEKPKIPHLGWNSVELVKNNLLFDEIDVKEGFYFLHSYYFECVEDSDILTKTYYGKNFASSVKNNNIYGVQFHPEKSHHNGVKLLQNFANLNA
ncbi:imidazole glycerol phosphate synthase subunit HisH [Chitinophagaceae bacterium LB-8]|uniref:Imidazole glycerol phosphate synthase subunit HisH n=1 Tax=Paraflavisolibacter caeni TaxID=2982496 RepID=A0A9X2XU41_9BACT|nr:imidazole glycerol phosphate synthase subunit HisH [Paraflavisolibacter caeni]MCU7548491.1 imidazole glycerol phosphate synthase subunit HisH [Paraflavisolibacter caeni]